MYDILCSINFYKILWETVKWISGTAEDIANVILFLASHLSDYMTGQSLEVNGGLYMP
jgi:NAD(P)-dependent dehydrogenase (short-subunit alcohol dehydrogenase family)